MVGRHTLSAPTAVWMDLGKLGHNPMLAVLVWIITYIAWQYYNLIG